MTTTTVWACDVFDVNVTRDGMGPSSRYGASGGSAAACAMPSRAVPYNHVLRDHTQSYEKDVQGDSNGMERDGRSFNQRPLRLQDELRYRF